MNTHAKGFSGIHFHYILFIFTFKDLPDNVISLKYLPVHHFCPRKADLQRRAFPKA